MWATTTTTATAAAAAMVNFTHWHTNYSCLWFVELWISWILCVLCSMCDVVGLSATYSYIHINVIAYTVAHCAPSNTNIFPTGKREFTSILNVMHMNPSELRRREPNQFEYFFFIGNWIFFPSNYFWFSIEFAFNFCKFRSIVLESIFSFIVSILMQKAHVKSSSWNEELSVRLFYSTLIQLLGG